MKIVAFNGSPAGKNSATNRIIEAFLKGASRAGADIETYQLMDYNINQCKGCFSCWFKSPGKCIFNDDMNELMEAYKNADVICFASPVFTWNVTGLFKNFVDRLVPLKSPIIVENQGNFDMENSEKKEQRVITISNAGFPGENNFEVIKTTFSCCNPCLEIYRNCGKLLVSKQEKVKKIVEEYLSYVEQGGYEFVLNGFVSENTMNNINKPIMSVQDYIKFLGM